MRNSKHSYRRRLFLNTTSIGIANIWSMVISLVGLPLLLKGLGSEAFGVWVLIQTMSAISGWFSITDLGMGTATTRAVAHRASLDDQVGVASVISSACGVFACSGVFFAALMAFLGPLFLPSLFNAPTELVGDLRSSLVIYSMTVALDLITGGFISCIEGLQRLDLARAIDAGRRTLLMSATVSTALLGGGLKGVAIASVFGSTAGLLGGGIVLIRQMSLPFRSPELREVLGLIRYGWTVAMLNATGVLHRTMDRLIVGAIMGPTQVVLVEIATQVQNGVAVLLSASSYTVISSSAWLRARQATETLQQLFFRGTKYSSFLVLPFAVTVMTLADPLVRLWVGKEFADAGDLAKVALIAIVAATPLQVGSNLLQGSGKAVMVLRPAFVAVVANFIASILFVRTVGTVGVFLGTLVGTLVLTPPLLGAVMEELDLSIRLFMSKVLIPSLMPAVGALTVSGVVLALPLDDLYTVGLGMGMALSVGLIIALHWGMDSEELSQIKEAIFPPKVQG